MFYRRKVILALLEQFGGEMGKISFQKLLFILTRYQEKPAFDFVPYKQGCFSFQSYADMRTMMKYGMVSEGKDQWIKTDKANYTSTLNQKDKQTLLYIKNQFAKSTSDDLIEYTYKKYPYYALKSTISHKFLTKAELENVRTTVALNNDTILYTIGYEGVSLETYLNKLILNDIKVLCDVRKNSLSMKYGFSKSQLQNACERLDIKYIHIPDLGIDSDKRQSLNSQKDYDELFKQYEKTTLKSEKKAIDSVLELLKSNQRIALTCFEAHQCQCHRGTLAKAITNLPQWKYVLKHL
jgi:uncharacterized protein (DUF488 family)